MTDYPITPDEARDALAKHDHHLDLNGQCMSPRVPVAATATRCLPYRLASAFLLAHEGAEAAECERDAAREAASGALATLLAEEARAEAAEAKVADLTAGAFAAGVTFMQEKVRVYADHAESQKRFDISPRDLRAALGGDHEQPRCVCDGGPWPASSVPGIIRDNCPVHTLPGGDHEPICRSHGPSRLGNYSTCLGGDHV